MDFNSNSNSLFMALLPSAETMLAQQASLANNNLIAGAKMLQKSRPEDAIPFFKRALAIDSSNVDAYNYLGNTYLQLNQNDKAIETFKKLVATKPFDKDSAVSLGNAYAQSKKYADAEKSYKKAVSLSPSDVLANYSLGQTYLAENKLKEAETTFQKVTRLSPRDANGFYGLGQTYNKMGKYSDAVSNLKQAISLKHEFFAFAENELGYAYSGQGDDDMVQKQITRLKANGQATMATQLDNATFKPKILNIGYGIGTPFFPQFGSNTPISLFTLKDPNMTLSTPNASKDLTAVFQFNANMDPVSIQTMSNWSITKAKGGKGGYYNNGYTLYPQKEANMPIIKGITYEPSTKQATVTFSLTQNANGDAVIDPSHLVFKFTGKDAYGKKMDPSGDEFDGFAGKAF